MALKNLFGRARHAERGIRRKKSQRPAVLLVEQGTGNKFGLGNASGSPGI